MVKYAIDWFYHVLFPTFGLFALCYHRLPIAVLLVVRTYNDPSWASTTLLNFCIQLGRYPEFLSPDQCDADEILSDESQL